MGSCVHGVRIGLLHDLAVDTDHTEHRARTLRGLRDAGKEQHDAQTGGERDRRAFPCHLASPRRPTGRSHGPGSHPSVIMSVIRCPISNVVVTCGGVRYNLKVKAVRRLTVNG